MGIWFLLMAGQASYAQGENRAPFLGVWAHATQTRSPGEADELMDRAKAAGIDAIYMLVWYWGGHAYYLTDLAPLAGDVEAGFDPLGYLVDGCHRRGIEIHAWYVNGESGQPQPGAVFEQHPDWMMVDRSGKPVFWYDLGKPEVRQFQSDLMIDVLERYDVDGIHFDYIRHPGRHTCYCDRCLAAFREQSGLDPADLQADTVPCALHVSANPLDGPLTATVLARFSNGLTAVYLNRLGQGQVLGLNYHAESLREGFATEAVRRFLADADTAGGIPVIWPPETAAEYQGSYPQSFVDALRAMGHEAKIADESEVSSLPPGSAAALVCAYRLSPALAEELVAFVEAGGKLVIVDGPAFAMGIEAMRTLTGMRSTGPYFSENLVIEPEEPGGLLPVREKRFGLEALAALEAAWETFQMQGPTALVRDVYRRAQAVRPEAKVTAAVFHRKASADAVYQDWYGWLEEGIVHYVIPMCYVTGSEDLEAALDEWEAFDPGWERIVPGLAIFRRNAEGTGSRPSELVLDQVDRCLSRGAGGTVFFSAHYLDDSLVEALAGLKAR